MGLNLSSLGGFGGGLGMLGGLFGGGQGGGLKALLREMERKQNLAFVRSQGYQLHGLNDLLGGYDKALANVKRTGTASKLDAISQGKQATAQVEQNLVNRGLSNTTFAAQVPAVSAGTTQRTLASIDQAVAQAQASLEAAKGNASNAAYGGLSALSQNYAQQQMMPLQMAFQQAASAPSQFDQLMQLLGAAGGFGGMFMGMAGGGMPAPRPYGSYYNPMAMV